MSSAGVSNTDSQNVAIAFALTIGAGLSTALGAAVVFIPSLVRFANRKTLAASLGLSAGVMIYVSFVEIYRKSYNAFMSAGHGKGGSSLYSTLTFFAGVFLMVVRAEMGYGVFECVLEVLTRSFARF